LLSNNHLIFKYYTFPEVNQLLLSKMYRRLLKNKLIINFQLIPYIYKNKFYTFIQIEIQKIIELEKNIITSKFNLYFKSIAIIS